MSKNWDAKTAEWYAEKYGEYATNRLAVDAMCEFINADSTVLDVGCGTGAALRHAAERYVTAGPLIGVDPVPRMIEIARERATSHPDHSRIEFREGSAESLPVDDASVDIILAFDSFDHWDDARRGLVEIRRVLRPSSGHFVVTKDAALPGAENANQQFLDLLAQLGFSVTSEQSIEQEDVKFNLWVCGQSEVDAR